MAINQFFDHFSRLFRGLKNTGSSSKILSLKNLIYLFSFFSFVSIVIFTTNFVEKKSERENQNFNNLIKTNEFLNLTDYLITKINNPYKEINYLIQRNDSIEKILNKYKFKLIKSFPHWQYLSLGYICMRGSRYIGFLKYFENIFKILKLSNIPVPYNMGQTTFIFEKSE